MIKEYLAILLLLAAILVILISLYATGIFKRKVSVTIVENLPLGIFKANIQESLKSNEDLLAESTDENVEIKSEADLNPEYLETLKEENIQNEDMVYWTPQGKHYHKIQNCGALLRSKVIHSGSIDKSGKSTGCHKCNKS